MKYALLSIIAVGLIVFSNGIFNNFIGDDVGQVTENPVTQSVQNLPVIFTSSTFYNGQTQALGGSYYRPLMITAFTLLNNISSESPYGFHTFQILLYITNACMVYLIFKHFFRKSLALILSLIFLVHPVNSEAAFYISNAQEVLFVFFGLIGLWLVINRNSQKSLLLAAFFFFASLLSKESGILFILMALVYVYTNANFSNTCLDIRCL